MRDKSELDNKLTNAINRLRTTSISTNGAYDAPIDKQNLEKLQRASVKALTEFKEAILDYLD